MSITKIIWRSYENLQAGKQGYVYAPFDGKSNIYIIYYHGTYGDVCRAITRMQEVECHKFFIEYPGYSHFSKSQELTKDNLEKDVEESLKEIFEKIETTSESPKIFFFGRSIGTGVMCKHILKYQNKISGIILETPFITLSDIAYSYSGYLGYLVSHFLSIEDWDLSTLHYIKNLDVPLLVISAEKDKITPLSHSQFIFNNSKSKDKRLIIYNGEGHGMKYTKLKDDIWKWITEFS